MNVSAPITSPDGRTFRSALIRTRTGAKIHTGNFTEYGDGHVAGGESTSCGSRGTYAAIDPDTVAGDDPTICRSCMPGGISAYGRAVYARDYPVIA